MPFVSSVALESITSVALSTVTFTSASLVWFCETTTGASVALSAGFKLIKLLLGTKFKAAKPITTIAINAIIRPIITFLFNMLNLLYENLVKYEFKYNL